MKNLLNEALKAIEIDKKGHLNAGYRNQLFMSLTPKQSFYVVLNTLFQNRGSIISISILAIEEYDLTIQNLLDFIDEKCTKDDFVKNNNQYFTFFENRINEGNYEIGYSGLALIKLGEEWLTKNFTVTDELEDNSDPENWSSLFYGSLVANGGLEDFDKIYPPRNREYWEFFLRQILSKHFSFSKEISFKNISKSNENIDRIQTGLIDNFTEYLFLKVKLKQIKAKLKCKKISFLFIAVYRSYSVQAWADDIQIPNKDAYLFSLQFDLQTHIQNLKSKMYKIFPNQGAWLSCVFNLGNDEEISYLFNYDKKLDDFDKFIDIIDFKKEIMEFPRTEKYIPIWLKNVIDSPPIL